MEENKKRYMEGKAPTYYTGKYYGIKASDVIDDFELNHYKASAFEYIVRSGKKDDNEEEQDIKKAINHLNLYLKYLSKQQSQTVFEEAHSSIVE